MRDFGQIHCNLGIGCTAYTSIFVNCIKSVRQNLTKFEYTAGLILFVAYTKCYQNSVPQFWEQLDLRVGNSKTIIIGNFSNFYQNPKSESMDFFAEIDHISIKIRICGKQSKFNVITKFGGKSPHQFWEITKNRCLGPGRFWMHVCHLVPITSDHDFVKLWQTFSTKICMRLEHDIFHSGPKFYSNR